MLRKRMKSRQTKNKRNRKFSSVVLNNFDASQSWLKIFMSFEKRIYFSFENHWRSMKISIKENS